MATAAFNLVEKYAPFIAEQLVTVNATTAQNQLYGDVNLGGLNWLERMWASYYITIGNPVLATGLMSFVLHEVSRTFIVSSGQELAGWVERSGTAETRWAW